MNDDEDGEKEDGEKEDAEKDDTEKDDDDFKPNGDGEEEKEDEDEDEENEDEDGSSKKRKKKANGAAKPIKKPKTAKSKKGKKAADDEDDNIEGVFIEMNQHVSLTFSLKYLVNFSKSASLSQKVQLMMSNDVPLLVSYNFNVGHIHYYLAPKIGDD